MHKASFFPRMAMGNLARNKRFYLPYLLTIMGTAAAYYIAMALAGASDLPLMTRYAYLSAFMMMGTFVIALFAIIFLTYTNSFLMKRRKKELGLYNILGMDKRNIAVVLGFESLYTAIIGVGGGIALGMLMQKLVTLLLYKIMRMDAYFGFYFSWKSIMATACLFCLILFANLLINLGRIRIQNPMAMLRESSAGEREPKTKWLTALLGVLALGGGYVLAVTTRSATKAIGVYFIAVFLVIIGTYCLFSSVSIVILKALRKNKKYYYKTNHFIGVSGMIYRMKRNAVGLSNICILSTMVLVMISGTLSLYMGTERIIKQQFPGNMAVSIQYIPEESKPFQADAMKTKMEEELQKKGLSPKEVYGYRYLNLITNQAGNTYTVLKNYNSESKVISLMAKEEYSKIFGKPQGKQTEITLDLPQNESITVSGILLSDMMPAVGGAYVTMSESRWFVMDKPEELEKIEQMQRAEIGENMHWDCFWNVEGSEEELISLPKKLETEGDYSETGNWERMDINTKEAFGRDYYSINGGFFFLGVFLGLLFVMATVLIIYYKQISEGYEDRERYLIMQKVGMEQKTVRRSVNSQILVVFFAPLAVAGVHIAFNFGLMTRLLTLFSLYDSSLVLWYTIGTFGVFALAYALVYWGTARTYYKIVQNKS